MAVYKVVGLEDAKVGYVSAGVIVYEDVPFANRADLATAVTNLTFEGDNTLETYFVSADVTGTLGADKFSTTLIEKVWGKKLLVTGNVASTTVGTPGSGYTSAPTVTPSGGGGTGFAATANISGGTVVSLTITNYGTGYTSAPALAFSGGGGTGAAATATLYAPSSQENGRIYFGNNAEFVTSYVEIVITAAAVNETANRAEKLRIVIPKAVPSPHKPGGLANRAKQVNEIEFSATKTTTDLTGAALSGVPTDGATYYYSITNPAA